MIFTKEEREIEIKRWENRLVKNCTICHGEGYVEQGNDRPAKMCECKERVFLNVNLIAAGVPRKFLNISWDHESFHNSPDAYNKIKLYSKNFIENYYDGRGVYLYGQQGRGKSMLECLLAKDIAFKDNPDNGRKFKIAFIIFEELVQMSHDARSNFKVREKMNTIISKPDLLIIDNLGSETGQKSESGHVPRFLEFILRKRNNDCLPTIISSNYTPEQLKSEYTDTIHQLIEENFDLVSVMGDNWRAKRGAQPIDDDFLMGADELIDD